MWCKDYNFTMSNTPPWMFFTFFKLYNWYRIAVYLKCRLVVSHFCVSPLSKVEKTKNTKTYLLKYHTYGCHYVSYCSELHNNN